MVATAKRSPRTRVDKVGEEVVNVDETPDSSPVAVKGEGVTGERVPPTHGCHDPGVALVVAHLDLNQGFPGAAVPHPLREEVVARLIRRSVLLWVVGLPDPLPRMGVPRVLNPSLSSSSAPGCDAGLRRESQVASAPGESPPRHDLPIRPGLKRWLSRGTPLLLGRGRLVRLLLRQLLLRPLPIRVSLLLLLRVLSRPGGKAVRLILLLGWLGLRGLLLLLAQRFRMALLHLLRIFSRAGSETICLIQL